MAPRCAYTLLPSIDIIYIYLCIFIFILAGSACTLPARERTSSLHTPPRSTNTLQYFHRHLGSSLIISCRHRPKSPAAGHQHLPDLLWIYMGHLNTNWAAYRSSTLFSLCPAHTPRSQQDFAQGPRGML